MGVCLRATWTGYPMIRYTPGGPIGNVWEYDVDRSVWTLVRAPGDQTHVGSVSTFAPHWMSKEAKEWLPDN
jgi:hypothetical protein